MDTFIERFQAKLLECKNIIQETNGFLSKDEKFHADDFVSSSSGPGQRLSVKIWVDRKVPAHTTFKVVVPDDIDWGKIREYLKSVNLQLYSMSFNKKDPMHYVLIKIEASTTDVPV